jgi:hypothetical protein
MKLGALAAIAAISVFGSVTAAQAGYTTVDLSNYVNEGFTNSWFINGSSFQSALPGTTYGNQGSSIPFQVAATPDGNGDVNNFWFGLYDGPGSLFGPPGSITIPVNIANPTSFNSLADNTFGTENAPEFSVTLGFSGGATLYGEYTGGVFTKDYNENCGTTGCDTTPEASYWYVNGDGQWLQSVSAGLPGGLGNLTSITFTQLDGTDGAILAGVTIGTADAPEPASWALMLLGVGGLGGALRTMRRRAVAA